MTTEPRISVPGYELQGKLGESPQSLIFKAVRTSHQDKPLVLKILKSAYLSDYQKKHYRQKIEHLKILNDPMLLRPLTFEFGGGVYYLTRQYFEGIPLDEWAGAREKILVPDFLTIAIQMAQALQRIQDAGVIHGGIKPHNLIIQPDNLHLSIIDFISSLDIREISHFIYDRAFVKGTLAYTSPEQTGRINHRVDYSTDLYSAGIVFYELLTGRLPFFSLDPLELIHSHLAEEAEQVHAVNQEIPPIIGEIIAKLILKQPEKRYQSAAGLAADLMECQKEYLAAGTVPEFPVGRFDYARRVTFVSKMVGRDSEAKTILEEYNRAAEGTFSAMLICGLPGIGKTRLIQELQRPIIKHRGYFTSGKFDLYQKNIPYSALIQSFRNLIRTFLTESDDRLGVWRKKALEAVGFNGRVLTDVIPELELLTGPQPEVESLPPVESRNRFNYVFNQFIRSLACKENPLTLFIDDLQWCDSATFDFLGNIFANSRDYRYLFFIGAYRNNEVDSSHPLARLIRDIKENKWSLREIILGSLTPKDCHEMVSYILDTPLAKTRELSDFITNLSEGNPLFVSEILSYLHNEDLLYLDKNRHWRWDLARIRESDMPPTVVALFGAKVKKLPPPTVEMLEYCACMGNRFSPTDIAIAKGIPLQDTYEILKPALAQGLLMESKSDLQFVHDRVQEAVLSGMNPENRRTTHWAIGIHLLSRTDDEADLERLDDIFTIAAHLNRGRKKKLDHETAYRLSDVNYQAGNKALAALATEAANEYFDLAKNLLPKDSWKAQYERTFRIYQKLAKTALMCGSYDKSEKLLNELLHNAQTDLDRAECLAEQTTSLSSFGNFIKAVETANRGLAYFGKSIPEDPKEAQKKREGLMREIEEKNIDVWSTILNMPFTKERKSKIELAFYSELIPDLYMSGLVPQLYLSAAQSTQHCLAGGMDESVIYSFTIMGLCLGEKGDFERAFKYEDLARDLCEKYPNTFGATRGMNGIVWCNMHSRCHPEAIVDYCLKSIQCGKNSGDLYNAGLSYGPLMWNLQVEGQDFRKIEDYATECFDFSGKYHLNFSIRLAEAMRAGWIEPMKRNYRPVPMAKKLKQWEKDNHVASAGSYFVHLGLVHYYFGDYEKAERYLQEVKRYLTGLTDNVLKRQWHVFLVLNAVRLHERGIKYQSREELRRYVQPLAGKVRTWAKLGPLLRPYLALMNAELERVMGNFQKAESLYLEAIAVAKEQKYTFLEGFLNECLGELLEKKLGTNTATILFREAARLYEKCGADRKHARLIEVHPKHFEEEPQIYEALEPGETVAQVLPDLNAEYLMKSAAVISSEIEEGRLMQRIMNILLESSGAQNGYLIMPENSHLVVQAKSHVSEKETVYEVKQNLEDNPQICHAIVRYVYRTEQVVLLENAVEKGEFKNDPQVRSLKLRSVLCLPVVKQHELIGVLYLENHLSDGIFTPQRAEMTKLLTHQAAISLENARLMDKMKLDISERLRAEEELRRSEENFRLLVESSEDCICHINLEGNLISMNPAGCRINELEDRNEAVGKSCTANILKNREDMEEALNRVRRGESAVVQYQSVTRKGKEIWWDSKVTPIRSSDGKITGMLRISRDITERKKMEEELVKAARIESIGILAGGIAHDFNNILTAVLGNISYTKTFFDTESKPRLLGSLQDAEAATLRAKDLTHQLLTFSKGGAPVKKTTSIGPLLREAAGFALTGSKVRGEFFIPENLWQVEIDDGQISQVINNMVINAVQAMTQGGIIYVEAENVEIGKLSPIPVPKAQYIKILIRDEGTGIAREHLGKIFDPYFTTKPKGSGLGLATCFSIIKRHNGHIAAESTVGQGTTFKIYLPASQQAEAISTTNHKHIDRGPKQGQGKILVMDDEEIIKDLVKDILTRLGYEAALASDGQEVLEKYREAMKKGKPFDAVILDLTIPGGMGGKETMEKLLEIDPEVKAIISSGYYNDPVIAEAKDYGFSAVISKPYLVDDLSETLYKVLFEQKK